MLSALFGKKKVNEDKLANIFVNSIIRAVDNGFSHVADAINNEPEFVKSPSIDKLDSDKFLVIVIAGNLNFLRKYFSNTEEMLITSKIISKLSSVFGMEFNEMKDIVKEYSDFMWRINQPSKNVLYAMSKAVFFKYNLGQYQDKYFAQLNAPNPIFLKRMDSVMQNFIWDWNTFQDKFKFTPSQF